MSIANTPEAPGSTKESSFEAGKASEAFQAFITNPKLLYQYFDLSPIPIEIFAADGMSIYMNRAAMEMSGITDASLIINKYNLKNDPVCIEIMGKNVIDRIFHGEAVTYTDFPAPVQDVLDRGVIDEKPWEAATMDLYFQPIWNGEKLVCTICFFTVKNMYKGRTDIVRAKEYIDNHWREDFDPQAVAQALNISLAYLRSLFRQHTGMTMHDYYKKVKVDHLKEKLADKHLSITEAFDACGVDSRGWIARVFKEITGMSPREYRDSLK